VERAARAVPALSAERLGAIGVVERAGRVLVVQRAAVVTHPGAWCFPGGHLEEGESSQQAVVRELREELGLEVEAGPELGSVRVEGSPYRLFVHRCRVIAGEPVPHPAEIADFAWRTLDEVATLAQSMPSNAAVIELLRKG
jgi:8-oxo-dGTP diphosphatase